MKAEILRILRNSDKHVSGQELCTQLGVSRTAVWKVINQLKEEGYEIEAISNKGYYIISYPDIITPAEVESRMMTKVIGRRVIFHERIDSTNNEAKRMAEIEKCHGTLVIANVQESGKGRRGKMWSSPGNEGIWMTIILNPSIKPINASMLTIVAALAVNKGIENVTGISSQIKWPNDIVINGKKICGILTEMSSEPDYVNHVVVGIGINAKMSDFPDEIKEIASSLFIEGAVDFSRAELISEIMMKFEEYYELFLENENLEKCLEIYNNILVNRGKKVVVIEKGNQYEAEALGINNKGELLITTDGKNIKTIISGEVSVRGIYGYV